jgi:long-chain acyl-CoA synthetase
VVCGEGRHYLAALLVPHFDNLRKALCDVKVADLSEEELAKHSMVRELLGERVRQRLADVAGYEQVRKFLVLPRPFSVAADELTVSLKLRRKVVIEKYRAELEALYREGEVIPCP